MKRVFTGIRQCLTLAQAAAQQGRHPDITSLSRLEDAACVVDAQSRIEWIGNRSELPPSFLTSTDVSVSDRGGAIWLPSLIECHTHCVYGGTRHRDYGLRCGGKTYAEIAALGGGILSTVAATRASSETELLASAREHLAAFRKFGIGVVEIKTGYGLDWETENKSLRVIRALQKESRLPIIPTFLPAHATPPEFLGRADAYVDQICESWIPKVAREKSARFFDVFIEQGYFSLAQAERLMRAATEAGLKIKAHVDQFTDLGGTSFAVERGAVSCDHLDQVSEKGIRDLADSQTVAVLLPGASCFTGTPYPPVRQLIEAGARVALSTDFNPGTCPSHNLPLMATLSCSQMGMSMPEAIVAMTLNAAAALDLQSDFGSLEVGKVFAVTELPMSEDSFENLIYRFGESPTEVVL